MPTPRRGISTKRGKLADRTTQLAREVVNGVIPAGPSIVAACRRHLADLEAPKERGIQWNPAKAKHVMDFFPSVLRLAGGEHEGKPFQLVWWQAFVIGSLFGWERWDQARGEWVRRFKIAFIETGKGSGKSPLAAGIGLFMLMADGENRPEIYSASTNKEQAGILFRDAVAMARQSELIGQRVVFSGGEGKEWNIAYLSKGGFFKPIASESQGKGKSGFRPHAVLLDEVHEHASGAMVEFMIANLKGRKQPLVFMITNSGSDKLSICWEYHEYGINVANQFIEDDEFFAFITDLPERSANGEKADPFKDESLWALVNPSLGTTIQMDYLRTQVRQAKGMPSKEGVVRRLNFCQWTGSADHWVGQELWDDAQADFQIGALRGHPCWLGLDLSQKRDLTSMGAVWKVEDTFYWASWFWTPEEGLEVRARRDKAPYARWVEEGHLVATPGLIIDQDYVAAQVQQLVADHDVKGLAFDQAQIESFQRSCDNVGLDTYIFDPDDKAYRTGLQLKRHGQGYNGWSSQKAIWMPGSIAALENVVVNKAIKIRRNPVLTYNSSSAVLVSDQAGNRKWEKRKSTGRIDGMVAGTMALGMAVETDRNKPVRSVYEDLDEEDAA